MKNQKKPLHLRPKDPKKTLIRMFSYFRYNKIMFFAGIFFIILSSAAQIGANGMLSPIIDCFYKICSYHGGDSRGHCYRAVFRKHVYGKVGTKHRSQDS
jgi:hypothetical protein